MVYSKEIREQVINLYQQGVSNTVIRNTFGCTSATITNWINAAGLPLKESHKQRYGNHQ